MSSSAVRHSGRAFTRLTAVSAPFCWSRPWSAPVDAASPGIDKVIDAGKQSGRNPDGTFPSGSTVTYTVAVSCQDDGGASKLGQLPGYVWGRCPSFGLRWGRPGPSPLR